MVNRTVTLLWAHGLMEEVDNKVFFLIKKMYILEHF